MGNIGLSFVNAAAEVPSRFALDMAKRTEELGFHSFWVNDRVAYDNLEPLSVVAAAAAVTQKIRIGTCILLAPLWSPVLLAKILASIDFLSAGRLIFGVGLGNRKSDYDALGIPFERRGARTAEGIQLMKRLWLENCVNHQGRFYQARDLTVGPRPLAFPHPPIWMGGSADAALRRVGRMADGYICGTSSLQRFPALWEKITAYTMEEGRDPSQIEKAGLTFFAIDDDQQRAVTACEGYLTRYYGRVSMDVETYMVVGSPAVCAERIAAIFETGVNTLILGMIIPELRQLDLLADQVLPAL